MIKQSKIGFHPRIAAKAGGIAAIIGAASGLLRPQPGESRPESAFKQGLLTGAIFGGGSGLAIGQLAKKSDKLINIAKAVHEYAQKQII